MAISDIVTVNITKTTKAVSTKGFGVMMFLDLHKVFNDRIRYYSTLDEMTTDGFLTTSNAYKAAQAAFSQSPSPQKIAIGRQEADSALVTVATVKNSTVYTVTINGTACTFTSSGSATAINIAAGLVSAINAQTLPVTITDHLDGTFTIVPTVAATPYTLLVDSKMTIALTAAETLVEAITAIRLVDDTWYGLATYSHLDADILAIAAYIETTNNEGAKIYGVSSSSASILTSATTDIASQLQALSYARTWPMYSATDTNYPECAWFGLMLPQTPGSATWKFKTLVGQVPDGLNTTQINFAENKNCNVFITVGGVNMTQNGTVADNEFIDTVVGIDWLVSNIEEDIFALLVSSNKVPYTDQGVTQIVSQLYAVLYEGINNGILANNPAPVVSAPPVSTISTQDRNARNYPGITFAATLAGAIHSLTINGYVSV